MRVLIVHPSFYFYGGAELCIVKLANFLVERGHEVDILTYSMFPEIREDLKARVIFPKLSNNWLGSLTETFLNIYSNYDVINFHNHPSELLLPNKYPSVWYCNEPETVLRLGYLPREEKIHVLNTISKVVVSDSRNASRFKLHYGIEPEIVPYGVDYEFWSKGREDRRYWRTEDRFTLLHVAMIHPLKRQLESVKMVANLKKEIPSIKLILAGLVTDAEYFSNISKYIQDNSLEDNVEVVGMLRREFLRDLYSSCDLLLHPIKDQGGWLAPFEAMSSGLLVLVSTEANCSDIISENNIGLVASINQMEEKILEVYKNPEGYKDMKKRASEFVRHNLKWERYCSSMERILEGVT